MLKTYLQDWNNYAGHYGHEQTNMVCGVLQGFVLGPLLVFITASTGPHYIKQYINYHNYVDSHLFLLCHQGMTVFIYLFPVDWMLLICYSLNIMEEFCNFKALRISFKSNNRFEFQHCIMSKEDFLNL